MEKSGGNKTAEKAAAGPSTAKAAIAPAPFPLLDQIGNRALVGLLRSGALGRSAAGAPNDPDERPRPIAVAPSPMKVQRSCAACATGEPCDSCAPVQRKAEPGAKTPRSVDAAVRATVGAGGSALDGSTRGFFESRFGRDLGDVRVHTDANAAGAARQLGARAFTVGSHVAFGTGNYAPGSTEGKRLLAHELTHVAQQSGAATPSGALPVSDPHDPAERAADETADRVMKGSDAAPAAAVGAHVQRQTGTGGSGPGDASVGGAPTTPTTAGTPTTGGTPGTPATAATPATPPSPHVQRVARLDELAEQIKNEDEKRGSDQKLIDCLPPRSDPDVTSQREMLQKDIDGLEDQMIPQLEERLQLLKAEIADLDAATNPATPTVGVTSPATEGTRRRAEQADNQALLNTLRRKQARRSMADIDHQLSKMPPGSSPERDALEQRKKELAEQLSSTAKKRLAPGTVTKDSHGKPVTVFLNEVRVGGFVGWADNNPGSVAGAKGSIGADSLRVPGHTFAVFPTMEAGKAASSEWFDKRPGSTIGDAITNYLNPIWPTDTEEVKKKKRADADAYIKEVEDGTGLSRTRTLGSLNKDESEKFKNAVLKKESGSVKPETTYTCDTSTPTEYRAMLGCDD